MMKKIIIISFYCFLAAFFFQQISQTLDPDFGWHLRVGQDISQTGQAPWEENYNFPLLGRHWVDHEWLADYLLFLGYEHFGYLALMAIFSLLAVLSVWLVDRLARRLAGYYGWHVNEITLYIFLASGALGIAAHTGVRVQTAALPLFVFFWHIIFSWAPGRTKILFWLVPLFVLWTNLHGSFLIGLAMLIGLLGWHNLYALVFPRLPARWQKRLSGPLDKKNRFALLCVFCFSLAATIINPYGLHLYEFLGTYTNTFYLTHIMEWLPAYYGPLPVYKIYYSALLIGLIIIYWAEAGALEKKQPGENNPDKKIIDPWIVVLTLFFFWLSLKSVRHFPLFFAVSLPLAAALSGELFRQQYSLFKGKMAIFLQSYLLLAILAVSAWQFVVANYAADPFTNEKFCRDYPCQAFAFIKTQAAYQDKPLFNSYVWGGWLAWQWPQILLFIDGRQPQIQFGEKTFLEEYFRFYEKDQSGTMLDQHRIDLVLVKIEQPLEVSRLERWLDKLDFFSKRKKSGPAAQDYLREYLKSSPHWQFVHRDLLSEIYVRKNP